jgi:5'-phosphate synthase pdxT subunit
VRSCADLESVERLVLPGGESTTMLHLLRLSNMFEPLAIFCRHRPVLGVCAGAILLATEVVGPSQPSLAAIPLRAHRNFYGSQRESFEASITVGDGPTPHVVSFIRAPLLEAIDGRATPEAFLHNQPVLFRYHNVLAASFHSELGNDSFLHEKLLATHDRRGA